MNRHVKFAAWNREQQDEFFTQLKAWEERVYQEYRGYVKDADLGSLNKSSINLKGVLDALPFKVRSRLVAQYKNIIGFQETIESAEKLGALRNIKGGIAPSNVLRVDPAQLSGPGTHPLAFIFNRTFIQGEGTAEAPYSMGRNILRSDYLRSMMDEGARPPVLKAGQKVLVFDTETTGLPYGSARGVQHYPDVRQISAAMMDVGPGGKLGDPRMVFDEHFRTARMQLGHIAVAGETRRMDRFIQETMMKGKRFRNRIPGAGEDFVDALKPFLRQMIEADIVVGQNVQFDIDQVFGGLARTTAYLNNQGGFADLLDQARDSVMKHGKIRDTLEMARIQLHDIDTARELSRATRHSMENLMLQSNLVDLLRRDLGEEKLLTLLGADKAAGTMHAAEVDTKIEAFLFKYLGSGELRKGSPKMDAVGRQIRRSVLMSYAPTPVSNIADISNISKKTFAAMVANNDGVVIHTQDGVMDITGKDPEELRAMLMGRDAPHATFRVTPIEQEIIETRRMLESSDNIDHAHLALRQGRFRYWANQDEAYSGFLNRFATLFKRGVRPSDESFTKLQATLAKEGVPFAGMSMPERWLTSGLARASMLEGPVFQEMGSELPGKVASVADDLGISRFAMWERANVTQAAGRNITLPLEILQEAERQGILSSSLLPTMRPLGEETTQMLSLSPFQTDSGKKMVNLVYDIGEEEAGKLSEWLGQMTSQTTIGGKRVTQYGLLPPVINEIRENLPTSGVKHGIAFARMGGRAGEEGFNVMESFYQGLTRDADKIPMRVGFMGTQGKVVEVGAAILDRFRSPEQKTKYARDLGVAMRRQKGLEKAFENEGIAKTAMRISGRGDEVAMVAEKAITAYTAVKKKLPIIGSIAAIGFGGYYLGKRHSEQGKFDVAMEQMSYESQRDYDRYRETMGRPPAQARRIMDPLATAGVVGGLHDNRIGHTQMGTDGKYSDLYVGVL